MPAKRNPFNENVNRLMEKIFSDKKPSRAPQRTYQNEMLPEGNGKILHDAQPGRKSAGAGKNKKKASGSIFGIQETGGTFLEKAGVQGNDGDIFLGSSLEDIRRATKKIRETTKQMQQMTLQMWEEAAQVKEKGTGKGAYGEERIPPRPSFFEQRSADKQQSGADRQKGGANRQQGGASRWQDGANKQWDDAGRKQSDADGNQSNGNGRQQGKYKSPVVTTKDSGQAWGWGTAPAQRPFAPQYRMEEALDDSMPERIRECRQMARSPQGYRMTKEELFFRQAQMMADYEDDCLYPGDFTWYFPTYQAMNAAQLRGYFTWRTQVRQGNITPAPLSFAFVYVYELLHQIGTETPQEGFSLLKSFWESYREYDVQLDRYLKNWICDYVVYYNLDRELLNQSQEIAFDDALLGFLQPQEGKEEEYFAAICALSKYNMEGSKFYKEYPEDVCKVTCGVFRALTAYYEKHGKKTLVEKYFGTRTTCAYQMFASAVFYDHKKYAEYEYEVNPLHRYRCVNGRWSCEKYFGNRTKNKEMGLILHAIDCRMRERYEYKALLKPEGMTKLVMNMIEKEIDRLLEEKKKNAAPVIEIDVTKLSGIRRAAELTRERLIVAGSEEDAETEFESEDMQDAAGGQAENAEKGQNTEKGQDAENGQLEFVWEENFGVQETALLNEVESTLLRFLLDGTPYQEFLRGHRQMLSVVVDAINEKLFDRFGDTVIVFDGDKPEVLEDYAGEVSEILSEV